MAKAKHRPPARIRYEEAHPTVSCRLDRNTHTLLKQRLEDLGVSFADFVKDSLGVLKHKMLDVEEMRKIAWNEGYLQGLEQVKIWYFCAVCGKRVDMSPDGNDHKAMIGYMKEHGWRHASCRRQ